ncbi:4-hydroxybenzoate polyprenyltransferase [Halorientalis persicus]|jgi:4-hydroxybenzoate polyprenyltransferase|uniref:4-hydroxybenzoate polyprenyltransferase n=1 Tax=Halorientalis persicus TaxID=1367881 RepID=A0A1H8D7C2_9EURY|nr:prenyltransferase [Halorientalis persicus]SEN03149.1 4-hydroxybenzoate polyprenyltransferase [Halorientalis persicus]
MSDNAVRTRLESVAGYLPSEETRLGYLFWLSRPRFWLYLGGPVIVGATFAADSVAELFAPIAVLLLAYFTIPANVFLYGVNDAFDADVDEENPKKDDKEVRYRDDIWVIMAVALSGALGGMFIFLLPSAGTQVLALWFLLAVEYSAPPLRFKTTPLLDSISNGLYILPGVIAFTAVAGELPPLLAIAGGWLWTMGMHTFSAIPDIEPDREAGIRTTATVLGKRRTYYYCAACWLAAAVAFAGVHWLFTALLLAYPVLVFGIAFSGIDVDDAYWWYPAINTLIGMTMTMGGLWVLLFGYGG